MSDVVETSPVVGVALQICFGLVVLGMVFALLRLMRGPSLPDRVVALDMLTIASVGFIACFAMATLERAFIDVAIALALVGFLATVAFARYTEQRARQMIGDATVRANLTGTRRETPVTTGKGKER